ncbi:Na+/H+ antiporter subunit A [Brevibacterium litoralis]|uniref:Na+/H+ antiporter subunit A n=1 Tax=Brevibacterium litoralis TaxID=3138935 RepID=UPI0032EF6895
MAVMVTVFLIAALLAVPLVRLLGRSAFLVLALVPLAGLVFSALVAPGVLAGDPLLRVFHWLPALDMAVVFRMDALAWIVTLLVTGVGACVFVYCARYFETDEPGLGRFAGVLMAFAGCMYGLVVADELLLLFVFWEGTTVFSYLLIGHAHPRRAARRAALQSLIVTTAGGLAMLVGMILLTRVYGTGRISLILESGWESLQGGHARAAVIVAILLILVGAVSKSALLPFHFWLPGAMAAPTPVSAYLHAAAMVKAGIYLVLRLAPGFHTMPSWLPVLLTLGLATMVTGGWMALRQFDLKLVLAYGTVSQLGFLTVLAAFGTRDVTTAALALLLSHALFKSVLFLTVGVIDHHAGTRDLRKLSGYWRASPTLTVAALVAAASMAGLPPTLGFVAKEAVWTALLDAGTKEAWFALLGIALGSVLTVAYTCRFVWGAFAPKRGVEPMARGRESALFVSPAVLLSVGTLVLGIGAAWWVDPLVAAHTGALDGAHPGFGALDPAYHLALWHGLEPALLFSAATLALGLLAFRFREGVSVFQAAMPDGIDFHQLYRRMIDGLERLAAEVTAQTQRGSLPFYQGTIHVVAVLAIGVPLVLNDTWPTGIDFAQSPVQVLVAVCMIAAAIAATRADKRFAAVVVTGVTGYGMVALFAFQGAPDLALTQILVETITIVVFVLVLRRLPAQIGRSEGRLSPSVRIVIGAAFGAVMMVVAWVAMGARTATPVSVRFPELAYVYGHGENIVNVTLVDIRAWDTFGETAVVVAAATGIASLVFVRSREGVLQRLKGERPSGLDRLTRHRVEDLADPAASGSLLADPLAALGQRETPSQRRNAWLIAGRTLAPRNRSIILEVTVRLVFHAVLVFAVYLLFAGHDLPGGGFAAGLVAGIALIARYLAGGRFELAEAVSLDAGKLLGLGTILTSGTALAGFLWGGAVLESVYLSTELPVLGYLSFGTSTIFDIGVFLIVVGLMLDVLRSLGAEVDRQQEVDEKEIEKSLSSGDHRPDPDQVHLVLGKVDDVRVGNRGRGGRL